MVLDGANRDVLTNSSEVQSEFAINQLELKRMINEIWEAIKTIRKLYMDNGDTTNSIISQIRENEEKVSNDFSKSVLEAFKPCFEISKNRNEKKLKEIFESNSNSWLMVLELLKKNICNCFLTDKSKIYEEILEFMKEERILNELENERFDPKDYLIFIVSTMAKICSPERDPLIEKVQKLAQDLPRASLFESQNSDGTTNFSNYESNLKELVEKISSTLVLMQSDMSCFDMTYTSNLAHKEHLLVASERSNFAQIVQMTKYLLQQPSEQNPVRVLPITFRWLERNDNYFAKAWAQLLLFDAPELPEIAFSSQDILTFLGSFFNNFIIISCINTFVESKFKENKISYSAENQQQLMKSVRRVMISSETNCALLEIDNIINNYFIEVKNIFSKDSKESLSAQLNIVCKPKSNLHNLTKERMKEFLVNLLSKCNDSNFDEELIPSLIPRQFLLLKKNLISISLEAVQMVQLNLKIYGDYYKKL